LSIRNENRRISGYTVGRPPTMPVRPGAMPVAAWAISRENRISAGLWVAHGEFDHHFAAVAALAVGP
jgi:hypothetical protein